MKNNENLESLRKIFQTAFEENDFFNAALVGQKFDEYYNAKDKDEIDNFEYATDLFNVSLAFQKLEKHDRTLYYALRAKRLIDKEILQGNFKYNQSEAELLIDIYTVLSLVKVKTKNCHLAEPELEKAMDLADFYFEKTDKKYFDCVHNLAVVKLENGDLDTAIKMFSETLLKRTIKDFDYIDNLNYLGYCYEIKGNYEKAIKFFSQAVLVIKGVEGIASKGYISNIYYIADLYEKINDLSNAFKFYEASVKLISEHLGEDAFCYAEVLDRLARVYFKLNKFKEALTISLKLLKVSKNIFGENHVFYANNLRRIASIYFEQQNFEKAISFYEKELEIKQNIIGKGSKEHIESVINLIEVYYKIGNKDKAEELIKLLEEFDTFGLDKEILEKVLMFLSKSYEFTKEDIDILKKLEKISQNYSFPQILEMSMAKEINPKNKAVISDFVKEVKNIFNKVLGNYNNTINDILDDHFNDGEDDKVYKDDKPNEDENVSYEQQELSKNDNQDTNLEEDDTSIQNNEKSSIKTIEEYTQKSLADFLHNNDNDDENKNN